MELNRFITNFASQLEDEDIKNITATTNFKELEEWSSLVALSIIAMIDEEYNISLPGEKLRELSTIEEIYNYLFNNEK